MTLAEFTLSSSSGQTFYDISLVDGYNIPMGIIAIKSDVPPNLTNPMCIGTASLLAAANSALGRNFGTTAQYPIPLEESVSWDKVQAWCPWDLQLAPPKKPGDGVYPYPDDNIKRPYFNPCYSACAKYNKASDCCIGSYNSPTVCKPSLYSKQAKEVCPDAYSFGMCLTKNARRIGLWLTGFLQHSMTRPRPLSSLKDRGSRWSFVQQAGHQRYCGACRTSGMSLLGMASASDCSARHPMRR